MKLRLFIAALLLLATSACAVQPPVGDPQPPEDEPTPPAAHCRQLPDYQVTFCVDSTDFPNPERGFHEEMSLVDDRTIQAENSQVTLFRSYVRLDDWRQSDLPETLLDDLTRGFAAVRASSSKVIVRFAYNFGDGPDTTLAWVQRHIEQLTPVLRANSDVIAVLQAGFIGMWGEWHGSQNGLTEAASKRAIGQALLEALPPERMVQVRTPYHLRHVLGDSEPFDPALAFTTAEQARLGFVNDCFLSGSDDVGTYGSPSDRSYARAMAPFTVTGGETCSIAAEPASRQHCPNALAELNEYHWDYLNLGYYRPVLQGWRDGGCFNEISRRLGYRFELIGASLEPGNVLTIGIRNTGFGKLYNPRPLELLLVSGSQVRRVTLAEDARQVLPLSGETIDRLGFNLPADLPAGNWQLELALPDAAPGLRDNPAYSIRIASNDSGGDSVWNAVRGSNRLGLNLQVPAN